MAETEWWQRGPIDGVPGTLQPVAHILRQVQESVASLVASYGDLDWNARPAMVAAPAFHLRHMTGVIDRLFTYARGEALTEAQFASLKEEKEPLTPAGVQAALDALGRQIDLAVDQLRQTPPDSLTEFRGVGRAQLPSTVIGCLVHGAEHAMRHVGQLSVTLRVIKGAAC